MINTPNGYKVTMLLEFLPLVPPGDIVEIVKTDVVWLQRNANSRGNREARRLHNKTTFTSKGKAKGRRGEIERIYIGRPGRAYLLSDIERLQVVGKMTHDGKEEGTLLPKCHLFLVIDVADHGATWKGGVYSRAFLSHGE